ncbi:MULTISPECIES: HEAT repeat domain-containing protein [Acidobacteriaceae]|uniref:HEAT repeat domain-containing protein n=1 Tax=Acidobacteriaceae TaxID=204434 RepID=UPI00131A6ABB|nr:MULTISPECIES: HEAT repeat domain-containing protein [Acidobacteriaceae]MDW5266337.1 HEAT repeat domain-containing protein [Edaphobacter sp.]
MKCETAKENILLASYGELPDEYAIPLEQHLDGCDDCRSELEALRELDQHLALLPVVEPSPNFLAQARVRLDEELDAIPPHGIFTQLRRGLFAWIGHVQSAPALATLLLGVGFLGGNFTYRYEVAHAPKPKSTVTLSNPTLATIANVTGIVQTPNSELVQVKYNKVVPETMEGSLDSPEIRQLLLAGTNAAATNGVRADSVALLAHECTAGHECTGPGIRSALLVSLRYDKNAGVRMKALEGLQRYVGQDRRVRDAVLEALMHDSDAEVRTTAIGMLEPVQADSSVREVLRTVSTQDENPYIRTASYQALQGAADIQ